MGSSACARSGTRPPLQYATQTPKPVNASSGAGAARAETGHPPDDALLAAINADLGDPRGPAKDIGRSGPGCVRSTASGSPANGCCGSCASSLALASSRSKKRSDAPHDRRIVTEAPNVMWATDATQIATVQDGKVWLFGVAEHWNAELLGWHVAKCGTRFEALQALGMAVRHQFGRVDAGAARGLALRHDHGSNFMSDAFQKQTAPGASLRATPSSASRKSMASSSACSEP